MKLYRQFEHFGKRRTCIFTYHPDSVCAGGHVEYLRMGNGHLSVSLKLLIITLSVSLYLPRPKGWERYRGQTFEQFCEAEDRKARKASRKAVCTDTTWATDLDPDAWTPEMQHHYCGGPKREVTGGR